MVRNPQRRAALTDAAIEVLAHQGARGLTFRAVDARAALPTGTASNYFTNRDDLLAHVADRIFQRLAPDPAVTEPLMRSPRDRVLVAALMRDIADRVTRDRTGYLALLELRLEATRRPRLRASLTRTVRTDLDANIAFHLDADLPGDRATVTTLYFAMLGLIVEHLTLPDLLADTSLHETIDRIVTTIVPEH
ncbi:TetR family transcriptional regulator [Thermobifida halotolerans]|uniref:TetR family transcriptional regulator n=2 Tax=Thermobifida halotolerans TaxID=483545 RepID=A0A399G5U4_9ACTN|nr:TetR/AcrR family transcriptional regulator [Thermobifida halotolerans]UOE21034.1 TetR family transcriptional regulator [Thermobifida halotolerans]